jgi:peptidoglycan/xylan/chitin deacetylase (PgdA/CDA1 family)
MPIPIPILMYHQIDIPPVRGTPLRGLTVAPKSFEWQMKLLRLLGYRGLSMRELEPFLSGARVGKVVGITFDDGYQNNVEYALPVLQKNRFTATCYGVSSMIGGTNSWDAGKVAEKPLMTLKDWRTWNAAGMDVGSHTCTHVNLNELDYAAANDQITRSKQELENAIGCEVRHFCYPYGWYAAEHQQMVRDAGYMSATTTQRGRVQEGSDPYQLQRVMVAKATNTVQFWMKIATRYEDERA